MSAIVLWVDISFFAVSSIMVLKSRIFLITFLDVVNVLRSLNDAIVLLLLRIPAFVVFHVVEVVMGDPEADVKASVPGKDIFLIYISAVGVVLLLSVVSQFDGIIVEILEIFRSVALAGKTTD